MEVLGRTLLFFALSTVAGIIYACVAAVMQWSDITLLQTVVLWVLMYGTLRGYQAFKP